MAFTDILNRQFLGQLGGTAGQLGPQGLGDLGQVSNYFRTLLSGNPQQIMQLLSPQANAVRQQTDAARKQQAATETARTGGTVAANQTAQDRANQAIAALFGQAQAGAAQGLANISDQELSHMLAALTQGSNITQSDINARRQVNAELWGSIIGGAGELFGGYLGGRA
jgi:hypothetical protein